MNAQILCDAPVVRSTRTVPQTRHWRALVVLAIGTAVGAIGGAFVLHHSLGVPAEMLPLVAEIDVYPLFVDTRPVQVITTANWVKVPIATTRDAVKSDPTLWRRMHFEDWDKLPDDLMEVGVGLANLLKRYGPVIENPLAWAHINS